MLSAIRRSALSSVSARAFSSSASRASDVCKLILIGRLGREPEVRTTRTDKEYVIYKVATNAYPIPSSDPNEPKAAPRTTWHTVLSFNAGANAYLRTVNKGSLVYVEANYELREPDPTADPDTPAGQRQIFLRHEQLRVLKQPYKGTGSEGEEAQ
ncbi:hypothetical protein BC835DRAFT_1413023 [Cytidiella melzeri]|nr:hypothetical protein BC835DRAFT_1413023 [Cytidiella melzeri]